LYDSAGHFVPLFDASTGWYNEDCFSTKVMELKNVLAVATNQPQAAELVGAEVAMRQQGEQNLRLEEEALKQEYRMLHAELQTAQNKFTHTRSESVSMEHKLTTEVEELRSELQHCAQDLEHSQAELGRLEQQARSRRHAVEELVEERAIARAEVCNARKAAEAREKTGIASRVFRGLELDAAKAGRGAAAARAAAAAEVAKREASAAVVAERFQERGGHLYAERKHFEDRIEGLSCAVSEEQMAEAAGVRDFRRWEESTEAAGVRKSKAERWADTAHQAKVQVYRTAARAGEELVAKRLQLHSVEGHYRQLSSEASRQRRIAGNMLWWGFYALAFVDCGYRAADALGW